MKHIKKSRTLTLLGLLVLFLMLALSLAPPTEVAAQGPPDECQSTCWDTYAIGQKTECLDHPDPPACHRSLGEKLRGCLERCRLD